MPHTTPMAMGAFRLLPAGLLLIAWASAHGRRQPSTPTAWAWVAAFGLVDAAAFQGFLAQGLMHTSAGLGSVIIDSQVRAWWVPPMPRRCTAAVAGEGEALVRACRGLR